VETEVRVEEGKKVGGIALGKSKGKEERLLEENGRGLKNIK